MASRKRKPLSIKEKLNILAVVDRNPKRKRIDRVNELGVLASTVNTVVSKRKEIETNTLVFSGATKQARGARHGELEEALLKWFKQARASGVNFDGNVLNEKALEIADVLGIDDFTASNGWISRFRARHGIAYQQQNGEAASVNPADVDNWLLDQWKPLLSFFLHEVKDKKSPSFLDSYQIPKAAAKQATAPAEKPDQCKTKRKNLTQAPSVPAKKAKVSCTQKTDQHCPTREERLFVFLSLETNRAYCLFLQNIIPIFEKVNLSLQAQAPQIHVLRSLLLELLRDIFSRFVNPSWLKRSPELLNLDYHSREAQKGDEDLIIGQETRTVVDKLKPSEQQEFFEAVRHYFVTVCDYMRHKFPLTDPALLNAEVVQLKTLDTMSFRKVRFLWTLFQRCYLSNRESRKWKRSTHWR
ncbi:hypothetical protein MTO96_032422 [Rhipicephalus appendiculatus]